MIPLLAAEYDPAVQIAQFGVLGVVVALFLFGFIYARPAVDDLRKELAATKVERNELMAEVRRLNEVSREVIVPAVTQATEMLREITRQQLRPPRPGNG